MKSVSEVPLALRTCRKYNKLFSHIYNLNKHERNHTEITHDKKGKKILARTREERKKALNRVHYLQTKAE